MLRPCIGYDCRVGRGLDLYSGRVIALGRLMLATLFLVALLIDVSQPSQAPTETYQLLLVYQLFAVAVTVATWNNWWLDAKLAGPAHAVDIGLFTVLVFVTEGYTSPFFVFFVFLLLSAAIRWGWKETTLTAILVAILYLVAGNLAASSDTRFESYTLRRPRRPFGHPVADPDLVRNPPMANAQALGGRATARRPDARSLTDRDRPRRRGHLPARAIGGIPVVAKRATREASSNAMEA